MFFIESSYLWLFPIAAMPIIIYLFNRKRNLTIDFSSILFLKLLETTSIKKIQIINIVLLIIRTMMIVLFILMLSRPSTNSSFNVFIILFGFFLFLINLFLPYKKSVAKIIISIFIAISFIYFGFFNNFFNNTSKSDNIEIKDSLIYIVVDNTFSMHNEVNNELKKTLKNITSFFDDKSYIHIQTLDAKILYKGELEKFNFDNINLPLTDYIMPEIYTFELINDVHRNDYANKFLFIIGDGKYLDNQEFLFSNFDNFQSYYLFLDEPSDNVSIYIENYDYDIFDINEPFTVPVTLINESNENLENYFLKTYINDIPRNQIFFDLESNTKRVENVDIIITEPGENNIYFELESDLNMLDNKCYLVVNIDYQVNIAIIGDSNNFIRAMIENGLNYNTLKYNMNNYSSINNFINTNKNESILIINGTSNINQDFYNYINRQSVTDKKFIFFPTLSDESLDLVNSFIGINYETNRITINDETNPNDWESFKSIDAESITDPYLSSLYNNQLYKGKREIKVNSYINNPKSDQTLIPLNDNTSLLDYYNVNNNEFYIFSISQNNFSSNFFIKGSSIHVFDYLLKTNAGIDRNFIFGDSVNFKNIIDIYDNIIIKNPYEEISYLNTNFFRYDIDQLGFYKITLNNKDYYIPSNINKDELTLQTLNNNKLTNIFSDKINLINDNLDFVLSDKAITKEVWKSILYFIIFLFILEIFISNYLIKNER